MYKRLLYLGTDWYSTAATACTTNRRSVRRYLIIRTGSFSSWRGYGLWIYLSRICKDQRCTLLPTHLRTHLHVDRQFSSFSPLTDAKLLRKFFSVEH